MLFLESQRSRSTERHTRTNKNQQNIYLKDRKENKTKNYMFMQTVQFVRNSESLLFLRFCIHSYMAHKMIFSLKPLCTRPHDQLRGESVKRASYVYKINADRRNRRSRRKTKSCKRSFYGVINALFVFRFSDEIRSIKKPRTKQSLYRISVNESKTKDVYSLTLSR